MTWDDCVLVCFCEHVNARYRRDECAVFRKTKEAWGQFSKHGVRFSAPHQWRSHPHFRGTLSGMSVSPPTDIQRTIIHQASPMAAKMKSKPYRQGSRPDFDFRRVQIMWWCLRVKLACNVQGLRPHLASQRGPANRGRQPQGLILGRQNRQGRSLAPHGSKCARTVVGPIKEATSRARIERSICCGPTGHPDFHAHG